jgi:hypothetical protein
VTHASTHAFISISSLSLSLSLSLSRPYFQFQLAQRLTPNDAAITAALAGIKKREDAFKQKERAMAARMFGGKA